MIDGERVDMEGNLMGHNKPSHQPSPDPAQPQKK
jgi:hypothetical protein